MLRGARVWAVHEGMSTLACIACSAHMLVCDTCTLRAFSNKPPRCELTLARVASGSAADLVRTWPSLLTYSRSRDAEWRCQLVSRLVLVVQAWRE